MLLLSQTNTKKYTKLIYISRKSGYQIINNGYTYHIFCKLLTSFIEFTKMSQIL